MVGVKIVLVGAGALGSHLVLFARNVDATWKVVDFDRVEQKNTLSQFHTRMGLGKNKAQALQQTMQGLFQGKLEAVPHKLIAGNAQALFDGADLVVDCLDNAASRRVLQDAVRERKIPCVHGALSADGQFGRVVWDEHFAIDAENVAGQATCEGGEHVPFIALVAATLAAAVQRFVADGSRVSTNLHPGGMVRL